MKWSKFKRIYMCIMVVLSVSFVFCNAYAAINENYYNDNIGAFKVADTKENLILKVISSILLDAIGSLVYALANLGEWLLGIIFQAASGGGDGNNIFPWADAIVFNAIPFLDVNFINPYSEGTVVGLIQDVIKSVYGTIFGLAISFFSIAVLVMGIKLAISTIASEKAKYKQAIWDWLLGLILLFTIHFFISFVFYLNEQLVNKASGIASGAFTGTEAQEVINSLTQNPNADTAVQNFIDAMKSYNITDVILLGVFNRIFDGINGAVLPDLATSEQILKDNPDITIELLQNESYRTARLGDGLWYTIDTNASDKFWSWSRGDKDIIRLVAYDVGNIVNEELDIYKESIEECEEDGDLTDTEETTVKACKTIIDSHSIYVKGEGAASSKSLIANLAQYFKKTAWSVGENSWKTNKVVIQNAIMYAILVVQSFIFLIAYVKRLFYVVILAMMAPAVVVYDFFNKSIS